MNEKFLKKMTLHEKNLRKLLSKPQLRRLENETTLVTIPVLIGDVVVLIIQDKYLLIVHFGFSQ